MAVALTLVVAVSVRVAEEDGVLVAEGGTADNGETGPTAKDRRGGPLVAI